MTVVVARGASAAMENARMVTYSQTTLLAENRDRIPFGGSGNYATTARAARNWRTRWFGDLVTSVVVEMTSG